MINLDRDENTPLYNISTAAKLCGLPVYTIRWLEKNGILLPSRSGGNQRMFCDRDINLLIEIANMLHRNVNVEGIKFVLEIKQIYHINLKDIENSDENG
ncbi:MAG: MerR family transcriptional regulator [Elusimicrobiaceae bacterium]|jgi:DNA-binding transcriptional MerR regulator